MARIKYIHILSEVILFVVKIIVHFYDIITLPVYAILQKPWINWSKVNAVWAKQIDPNDLNSAWVNLGCAPKHFIDDCLTVNEAIDKCLEINGRHKQCLGYREVLDEEIVYSEGKPINKYVLSDYKWITFGKFEERMNNIGKGLLLSGVKSGDNVMIFADTSIDWFICSQSILKIGATVATLYSSLSDEGIIHGMNETEVTHVLTSHQLLPKLILSKNKIPKMSTIIYFNSNNNNTNVSPIDKLEQNPDLKVTALSVIEDMGKKSSETDLVHQKPKEDDIAVLLYTSGSTGLPKGVKISHKNFVKTMIGYKLTAEYLKAGREDHVYIGYLPLAHILEFLTEVLVFVYGIKIGYSSPLTLTDLGTAIRKGERGDSTLLKPTVMAAVPLVLDRIRKGIYDKINKNGLIVRKLFDFAVDYKWFWAQKGFDTTIMNRIFCQKFRQTIGGEICVMLVGGAPLSQDTQKLIKSCLNIKLIQGYASTETTGAGCMMDPFDQCLGRVGPPLSGSHIKLIDWEEGGYRVTDKPIPRGEIVIGSDSVSAGYFKLESATEEAFYTSEDGRRWFRTGDIGEVYPNGTFKIIDRKKDLIKLQFGEYVSLGKIESELKSNLFVDNICVCGHLYQSYLVALIIPNQLSVVRLAKRLNIEYNSLKDLYENEDIIQYIINQLKRHGMNARLSKHEIPQKIMLCTEEWTPDNELLTAAMKIKRKNITNKYQKQIDLMYENNENIKQ